MFSPVSWLACLFRCYLIDCHNGLIWAWLVIFQKGCSLETGLSCQITRRMECTPLHHSMCNCRHTTLDTCQIFQSFLSLVGDGEWCVILWFHRVQLLMLSLDSSTMNFPRKPTFHSKIVKLFVVAQAWASTFSRAESPPRLIWLGEWFWYSSLELVLFGLVSFSWGLHTYLSRCAPYYVAFLSKRNSLWTD